MEGVVIKEKTGYRKEKKERTGREQMGRDGEDGKEIKEKLGGRNVMHCSFPQPAYSQGFEVAWALGGLGDGSPPEARCVHVVCTHTVYTDKNAFSKQWL